MEDVQDVLNVSVIWRGNKYVVEMNPNASLKDLGHELQKLTGVKEDTMRFIVPKNSKLLSPFSDEQSHLSLQEASIAEGRSVRMMGVSEDEVDKVQKNAKADLRIAGFDEEEKRMRQRKSSQPHAPLKLPQGPYAFCDFRTLELPGVELNPPASEALKRMHMLASDPGIVAIMNKHRWRVGIMTEMAPIGYVGVSPKCILGFNKNHGEEISLRLRTDDLKGLRKYQSIKKTLLHELAHMVYSEHDANFYALDKQLNEEAASLDWTRSRGHTLSTLKHSEQYEEDFDFEDSKSFSQKLGGNMSDMLASARASSVIAAYQRLANASVNSSEASRVYEEPNPDDSGANMNEEPDPDDSGINIDKEIDAVDCIGKENLDIESPATAQSKPYNVPDPYDYHSGSKNFEPDPDDSNGGQTLQSNSKMSDLVAPLKTNVNLAGNSHEEHNSDRSKVLPEPVFSNSLTMGIMNSRVLPNRITSEPDPDDFEANQDNFGHGNIARPDESDSMTTESMEGTHLKNAYKEPDPDESQANGVLQAEPDPDDNMMTPLPISSMNEPDPDDQELRRIQDSVTVTCGRLQKAIEMLRVEVGPKEVTTVLQTLFKIISNVISHPDDMKFKRLRKANPIIQKTIANYKAAMEILVLIGFSEDVILDEIGKAETYLVLKRNDPGLLWLAKSSLEACIVF